MGGCGGGSLWQFSLLSPSFFLGKQKARLVTEMKEGGRALKRVGKKHESDSKQNVYITRFVV